MIEGDVRCRGLCQDCAPGAILSTRSMTPWPTVPLPPMLARPAALMTSCSLSATLICASTFLSLHRPKDPVLTGEAVGVPKHWHAQPLYVLKLKLKTCCIAMLLLRAVGWPR